MRELAERDELSPHYKELEKEAEVIEVSGRLIYYLRICIDIA